MKLLSRILIAVAAAVAFIIISIYWVAPVALSFYAARKAGPIAKVVPTELGDQSISQAPGTKLAYLGYEFEVPWSDLDAGKTALYPKDKPAKTRVVLAFHSGLKLAVTPFPARELGEFLLTDCKCKMPRQAFDMFFGSEAATSDYAFVRNLYSFTPNKMHFWSASDRVHIRELMDLRYKMAILTSSAQSGIFNVQNRDMRGFQQGNPKVRRNVLIDLYADDGDVELMFDTEHYTDSAGLSQPEINRIVQSLHRIPAGIAASSQAPAAN